VERLARALPRLGVRSFAATWLSCEGVAGAFVNMRHPTRSARCEEPLHRNMERLILGGRGTVADRVGGSLRPERGPSRCKDGVARGASPIRKMLNVQKAKPSDPLKAGRGWGILNPTLARARPTAATRSSPPRSEAEGSAAAADVLARQREQPTGGRRHSQGSGWTGAACADPCEERAGASR